MLTQLFLLQVGSRSDFLERGGKESVRLSLFVPLNSHFVALLNRRCNQTVRGCHSWLLKLCKVIPYTILFFTSSCSSGKSSKQLLFPFLSRFPECSMDFNTRSPGSVSRRFQYKIIGILIPETSNGVKPSDR